MIASRMRQFTLYTVTLVTVVLSALALVFATPAHAASEVTIPVTVNGVETISITPQSDAPAPAQSEVKIDHSGTITLPVGTAYKSEYLIKQLTLAEGVTYDSTEYTVYVYASQGEGGTTDASVVIGKNGKAEKATLIAFENVYPVPPKGDPDPGGVQPCVVDPPVKKEVEGIAPEKVTTEFEFAMQAISNTAGYAVEAMPMPAGASNGRLTKTIKGPGEVEFGTFAISKAGTYVYEIVEVELADTNWAYDKLRRTVTFVVTEENGKLVAARSIVDENNKQSNSCTFVNTYLGKDDPNNTPNNTSNNTPRTSKNTPQESKTPNTSGTSRTPTQLAKTGDDAGLLLGCAAVGLFASATALSVVSLRRRSRR